MKLNINFNEDKIKLVLEEYRKEKIAYLKQRMSNNKLRTHFWLHEIKKCHVMSYEELLEDFVLVHLEKYSKDLKEEHKYLELFKGEIE